LWYFTLVIRYRSKNLEILLQILVKSKNSSYVTTSVAIVRSRPNSYQLFVEHEFVPVMNKLVSARDDFQIIDCDELFCHATSEQPSSSSRGYLPSFDILRIRPHQIAEVSLVRYFLVPVDGSDLVQSTNVRGQTTMDAKNATVNERGNSKQVEYLGAVFPSVGISVLLLAFVIESVDLVICRLS